MRAHYVRHVPFEGIGSMQTWLEKNGFQISQTAVFRNDDFPPVQDIDILIVMGGPMSIHDEKDYPWLIAEKAYIRSAIDSGIPVLGVCLGAQLIASVLGARVYRNEEKEIGWFPVYGVQNDDQSDSGLFCFPDEMLAFHWHGETFELPAGAVHLARSEQCENQSFQWGKNVIALQFHLETTAETAQGLLTHCSDELVSAPYIQSANDIRLIGQSNYQSINLLMEEVLAFLCSEA